jgi:low temperature requirement protein LtrA
VSDAVSEPASSGEHAVTPLELFFDLVFVFAITQVTTLLTHDPTWHGVLRGTLVLAAIWWAWTGYAWLTSTLDVDEGGVRLAMLASMAAMLGVALAVPGAFGDDAALFGFSFLLVRVFHLVLYANAGRDDPDLFRALLRIAPTELIGATLLVLAAFLEGGSSRGSSLLRSTTAARRWSRCAAGASRRSALAALALVSANCSLIVAYDAIRYRSHGVQIRHPELTA